MEDPGVAKVLPDFLDLWARRSPEAVAVAADGATVTYRAFAAKVNQLARHLISRGVGPEDRVVVAISGDVDSVVGLHAAVAAGAAVVPLDTGWPVDRIEFVLHEAAPAFVLATTDGGGTYPVPTLRVDQLDASTLGVDSVTDADRARPLRPGNAALVLYSSGSTGRPKGRVVSHSAAVGCVSWMVSAFEVSPRDVYLKRTSRFAVEALWGYWLPLAAGARLSLCGVDESVPERVGTVVARERATLVDFTDSEFAHFIDAVKPHRTGDAQTLRLVLLLCEELAAPVAAAWGAMSSASLVTLLELDGVFGPALWSPATPADSAENGGVPAADLLCHVLDSALQPVPDGVDGGLHLAGPTLVREFHGRPDLTSALLVPCPVGAAGERMFAGNLRGSRPDRAARVRYLSAGIHVRLTAELLDKEVSAALRDHPAVRNSLTLRRPSTADRGYSHIVCYLELQPGRHATEAELLGFLQDRLGAWRLDEVVVLGELPLRPCGLVDGEALSGRP